MASHTPRPPCRVAVQEDACLPRSLPGPMTWFKMCMESSAGDPCPSAAASHSHLPLGLFEEWDREEGIELFLQGPCPLIFLL